MTISRRSLLAAAPVAALPLVLPRILSAQQPPKPEAKPAETKPWQEFTPQSDRAVQRGNEFLMKTLGRNGGCGVDIGQPDDIGCTAMVALALMAQGNTPVEGPHSREVQRILTYMLQKTENMPAD